MIILMLWLLSSVVSVWFFVELVDVGVMVFLGCGVVK